MHALNLKSGKEWSAYCRSGQKPNDIPAGPAHAYADNGWGGWGDWLGASNKRSE